MSELEVYKAVNKVTAELAKEGIEKGRKNAQQGYMFRGIDDIYNSLSKLLAENNLCILPFCEERETKERTTQKGGVIFYTTVKMKYKIVSSVDGSNFECLIVGEAMDSADKSTNKAMSAAYKYLCLQIFCIPTEGDNDADGTTPEPVKPITPPPAQKPSPKPAQKPQPTLEERIKAFRYKVEKATLEDMNKWSSSFNELRNACDEATAQDLLNLWNSRFQFLMQAQLEDK